MRKGLAWLAGGLGLAALLRALTGRRRAPVPAPAPPDPAAELRAAVAESRPEEPAPDAEPTSLEERRRKVHERAQEAIDSMHEPPPVA